MLGSRIVSFKQKNYGKLTKTVDESAIGFDWYANVFVTFLVKLFFFGVRK